MKKRQKDRSILCQLGRTASEEVFFVFFANSAKSRSPWPILYATEACPLTTKKARQLAGQ